MSGPRRMLGQSRENRRDDRAELRGQVKNLTQQLAFRTTLAMALQQELVRVMFERLGQAIHDIGILAVLKKRHGLTYEELELAMKMQYTDPRMSPLYVSDSDIIVVG